MREQSIDITGVQITEVPLKRDPREAVPSVADGVKNSMLARMALIEEAYKAVGTESEAKVKLEVLEKVAEEKIRTGVELVKLHRIRGLGEYALLA